MQDKSVRFQINIGLLIGMLYAFIVKITGIGIPCLFRKITGLKCPGCGITTLFINLMQGNFKSAILANPCMIIVLPLLGAVLVSVYIRNSWIIKKKWERVCLWISLIILLSYGFLRNLPILMDFCRKITHI